MIGTIRAWVVRRRFAWPYVIAVALAVSAVLRFHSIGEKGLWMDEASILHVAERPLAAVINQAKKTEAHPPLYPLLLHLWLNLGRSEARLRSFSAVASIAAVLASAVLARRLYGEAAGIFAAFLMATSSYQVFYAQEARLQALSALLAVAAAIAIERAIARGGRLAWVMFTLTSALLLYTYLYGALAVIALTGAVLLRRRRRKHWKELVASALASLLLFVPWLGVVRARFGLLTEAGTKSFTLRNFLNIPSSLFEFSFGYFESWTAAGTWLLLVPVLALLLWSMARSARKISLLLGLAVFFPLAVVSLMPARLHEYQSKHLMFVTPMFLVLLAGGIAILPGNALRLTALGFLVAVNAVSLRIYYLPEFVKEDWRGAARMVAECEEEGDAAVFSPPYCGFAFDYYYRGELPRAGLTRDNFPGRMGELLDLHRRVWLVENLSPVARPDPAHKKWLDDHCRREKESVFRGNLGLVRVTLYGRTPLPAGHEESL